MKEFKAPDLNAPRFRTKRLNFLNRSTLEEFKGKYPYHSDLELQTFSDIIKLFNGMIWQTVIDYRDGVELPESLGHLFIGTCPTSKKVNVDFKKSKEYGKVIQNKNWDTDNKLAKIFYTNYYQKYRFANRELWGFEPVRQFKRTVASVYPENYQRYVVMNPGVRISTLYKKAMSVHQKAERDQIRLEEYDEFKLD